MLAGAVVPHRTTCGPSNSRFRRIYGGFPLLLNAFGPAGSTAGTWQGFDEMDEVGGDGSAELDDDGSLEIEIRFHLGDEAILKARKW